MTVLEFIKEKLGGFGYPVIESEVSVAAARIGISANETHELITDKATRIILYELIPSLLLMPKQSEGQFSVEFNSAGLLAYYGMLCDELEVPNKISAPRPTVTDRSYLWG